MDTAQARDFCENWLDAWSGNRPETLITFYSDDAFYRDPARPDGLRGRDQLSAYFARLLAGFPDWRWTAEELFETPAGFNLKWKAEIPVGDKTIVEYGMDIVEIADGLIIRNEVYFDRTEMLSLLSSLQK